MSRTSIKERNKAIRQAWEKEHQLVQEGKGTRDWTKEQQQDILDPDKGKAYDDQGRAFEGQHMKSAAEYPEYQGNPDNIQFLTRDEHLEAHKGSWQNPTNWYYDPKTGKYSLTDRISSGRMTINGGRESGFRTFTRKKNVPPGKYRVEIAYKNGAVIGSGTFEVFNEPPEDGFVRDTLR